MNKETDREPTHNEYVLDLTRRLQNAVNHDMYFALSLYEQSTDAELEILESLIGLCNGRRSEELSDESKRTLKYLKDTDRHAGQTRKVTSERRLFKVGV